MAATIEELLDDNISRVQALLKSAETCGRVARDYSAN